LKSYATNFTNFVIDSSVKISDGGFFDQQSNLLKFLEDLFITIFV
jgi:hypothetical protein